MSSRILSHEVNPNLNDQRPHRLNKRDDIDSSILDYFAETWFSSALINNEVLFWHTSFSDVA